MILSLILICLFELSILLALTFIAKQARAVSVLAARNDTGPYTERDDSLVKALYNQSEHNLPPSRKITYAGKVGREKLYVTVTPTPTPNKMSVSFTRTIFGALVDGRACGTLIGKVLKLTHREGAMCLGSSGVLPIVFHGVEGISIYEFNQQEWISLSELEK